MRVLSDDDYRMLKCLGITRQEFSYTDAVTFIYRDKRVAVYRDGIRLWNVYSSKGWRKFYESSSVLKHIIRELTEDVFIHD